MRNTQRAIGTRLSSHDRAQFGMTGLQPGHLTVRLRGSAGQSLGAFAVQGLKLEVFGDANDYVGKGLSGGTIVAAAADVELAGAPTNTIIGNTVPLRRHRRQAVRRRPGRRALRGAQLRRRAVVEGCGSNGCEYMTGGVVGDPGPRRRQFRAPA